MSKNNNLEKMTALAETVASARECTGLVARGPKNNDELENCMQLMRFSPQDMTVKK